jgi:hypothetical protein
VIVRCTLRYVRTQAPEQRQGFVELSAVCLQVLLRISTLLPNWPGLTRLSFGCASVVAVCAFLRGANIYLRLILRHQHISFGCVRGETVLIVHVLVPQPKTW